MEQIQVDHKLMNKNDLNSNYNMADAVFTACFLNTCLRHCDTVGMANFSPVVNTVGAIYTYSEGIVLRPSYHVFDLFTNSTFEEIVHSVLRLLRNFTFLHPESVVRISGLSETFLSNPLLT